MFYFVSMFCLFPNRMARSRRDSNGSRSSTDSWSVIENQRQRGSYTSSLELDENIDLSEGEYSSNELDQEKESSMTDEDSDIEQACAEDNEEDQEKLTENLEIEESDDGTISMIGEEEILSESTAKYFAPAERISLNLDQLDLSCYSFFDRYLSSFLSMVFIWRRLLTLLLLFVAICGIAFQKINSDALLQYSRISVEHRSLPTGLQSRWDLMTDFDCWSFSRKKEVIDIRRKNFYQRRRKCSVKDTKEIDPLFFVLRQEIFSHNASELNQNKAPRTEGKMIKSTVGVQALTVSSPKLNGAAISISKAAKDFHVCSRRRGLLSPNRPLPPVKYASHLKSVPLSSQKATQFVKTTDISPGSYKSHQKMRLSENDHKRLIAYKPPVPCEASHDLDAAAARRKAVYNFKRPIGRPCNVREYHPCKEPRKGGKKKGDWFNKTSKIWADIRNKLEKV